MRTPVTPDVPDPTKRPRTDKEKLATSKAMKFELKGSYKIWVDQDVRWIITDEELSAFKHLSNDEERDAFIENFWLRRTLTPSLRKTSTGKSITRALPMRMSTLRRAARVGGRIAA